MVVGRRPTAGAKMTVVQAVFQAGAATGQAAAHPSLAKRERRGGLLADTPASFQSIPLNWRARTFRTA